MLRSAIINYFKRHSSLIPSLETTAYNCTVPFSSLAEVSTNFEQIVTQCQILRYSGLIESIQMTADYNLIYVTKIV